MLITPPSAYAQGFHTKAFAWRGIYVLGNNNVSDEAVNRAAELVFNVLAGVDPGLIAKLAQYTARFAVIPFGTDITDLPDYDDLPPATWSHYRGLGGVIGRPTSSSGEENLVPGHPNDPYFHEESIGLHEWLHAIEGIGLAKWNPTLHQKFQAAYTHAKAAHLWDNTYAGSNFYEYFAETGQAFFNNNPERSAPDGIHNSINTRAELQAYDPEVYALHLQLFGNSSWTVGKYYGAETADTLTGDGGANLIYGNGGADSLAGKNGNDNLIGGNGLDSLTGGGGKDVVEGGNDDDTLNIYVGEVVSGEMYDGGNGADTLRLGKHATILGSYSIDLRGVTLRSIENITLLDPGENGAATVKVNAAQLGGSAFAASGKVSGVSFGDVADRFEVTMGDRSAVNLSKMVFDSFGGSKDRVVVLGDATAEKIVGSRVSDSLSGGGANDTLTGGLGKDTLNGGSGSDKFAFNTALSPTNIDMIAGFTHDSDVIWLDDAIFKGIGTTLDAAEFYAKAGAVKGHDLNDRIIYNTSNGRLYFDADGNKPNGVAAIHFATISNKPAGLDAFDFHII